MNLYLLPNEGTTESVLEVASRAGVEVISPANIRELILQAEGHKLVFALVSSDILLLANRYTTQLFDTAPSTLHGAPGMVYTGEWVRLSAAFDNVDWREMERRLAKSGTTGYTPEDIESRDRAPGGPRLKGGAPEPHEDSFDPADVEG